ncbi:sericin 1 [Halyomorpha halys]|uniref:sericin 1 n=1 Tax=Halyomorpha halys TaxID=286706 RepID=UPI0006D5162C|nr:mediator of RNA polymerase II transcription subunit 12-like [Halyomorpha halys]KAE8573244.1 Cuticle Protein CPR RR-1 [Halyomorpha halys]
MYKIFAVLCIVGCTLAKEKGISPSSESSRRLKARQVGSVYGLGHYLEPLHHVVDYVHEPQVVGSAVHYVEPSVVSLGSVQTAAPLVHSVGPAHQVYNYVPSVGYDHPYNYRYQSASATPFAAYNPVSSQQFSRVQSPQTAVFSGFTQSSQQPGLSQITQQAGFSQETQQAGFSQETQQAGFSQGTQQSQLSQDNQQTAFAQGAQQSFVQSNQQPASQSEVQTDNVQTIVGQSAQQTGNQQSDSAQTSQGAQQIPSQQNGRFQFGILHSGFGQQQQLGIVQTPSSQATDSQASFGQRQEAVNDQSGGQQSVFGGSQQSGSVATQQTSGNDATQQNSGSFSPSTAVSTVAVARQQPSSAQTVSQQTGGSTSPASTSSFGSQTFGFSQTQGAPAVRLIQPYNLSPSYAIHGLGFRTIQSGAPSAFVSGTQESQVSASQSSASGSQQLTPTASEFQFSPQGQSSGSQQSAQGGAFRSETANPSGIQYSYTSQQSASQPATVRSGTQASSSAGAQSSSTSADGQVQGSLTSFRSSFVSSGDASQDSSSGSQNTSPTQQPPAILRMSNDLSFDGSFNYGFESENGISSSAVGSLRTIDAQHPAQIISGSYSYTAPDGTPISTNYYADETGFHAQGAHLPTPHPLPEYVARALQILPQQGNADLVQPTVESN